MLCDIFIVCVPGLPAQHRVSLCRVTWIAAFFTWFFFVFVPIVLLSPCGSAGGFCEFFHNATLPAVVAGAAGAAAAAPAATCRQSVIVLRFTFPQCVCVCMFSFYLCYNFPYAFSILCAASLFLPVAAAVCYNFPLFCSILIWFHKVLLFVFQAFILAFLYTLLLAGSIMNLSCNICKP